MIKKTLRWTIIALMCALITASAMPNAADAQSNSAAPQLIQLAAKNQDRSLSLRDRCRYQQKVRVEIYKKKKGTAGDLDKLRVTTAIVEPSPKPDETGQFPVITRVIEDTDDKGRPKKADADARTGLASGVFLDQLFFPLLPEKINYMEFEELKSDMPGEKLFRFRPKSGANQITLASGQVYLNPETGAVLTLKIDSLHNLETLDKILKKLENIYATVDFSEFDGKYRMPTLATGGGDSDISRFKGIFKFTFEESKYVPVLNTSNF